MGRSLQSGETEFAQDVLRELIIAHLLPCQTASRRPYDHRRPLQPTVVRLTAGKPSQLGRGARFIPSNLVRCEQFDNDIPVAFRIHL